MNARSIAAASLGALLLIIGLIAAFYERLDYGSLGQVLAKSYPFQTLGVLLIVAGLLFIGAGLLRSR